MNIFIRTDSSRQMGVGHVMRCLTLADVLRSEGAEVSFICRELPGHICELVEVKGYGIFRLPYIEALPTSDIEQRTLHSHWLGVGWEVDAEQTLDVLSQKGQMVDWMVVDHYALGKQWEATIRPFVKRIMIIDDLADRPHDCDLIVDQNLFKDMENRYEKLIPGSSRALIGPKYALLHQQFIEARKTLRKRNGTIERILVFFGGSDPTNETLKALGAMRMLNRDNIAIDVVIGAANPYEEQIRQYCADLPNVTLYNHTENMAQLMAEADLAIGAGGVTTWERCCLGLPAVIIAVAYNQVAIAKEVDRHGAGIYLGVAENITADQIKEEIEKLLSKPDTIIALSKKAASLVDGQGAERVMKVLKEISA